MLKRRSSRMAFFSPSTPSKRPPASAPPKPGRTLVLSSTSSSVDLGHIVEEGFSFDFEKSNHFDNLAASEPLFNDFFLPPVPHEPPPPPPPLPDENLWAAVPSKLPSLRWSMETDAHTESDDDDLLLDKLCDTPPAETVFTARPITIVYSGRPRLVDLSPSRLSSKRPSLRSDSHSRTSSVSTRDSPLSPSSRFSDADDNSSPASSISEYSNIVYNTIPEEPSFQVHLPEDARLKPLKRPHGRNMSVAPTNLYFDDLKNHDIKVWDVESSPTSSIGQFDTTSVVGPKIPNRISSFDCGYAFAT